ncbi:MAG: DNA polymerase I [Oscillospiraceae bacterium]|nr:DNA polymerase I [Oscillospiraceae bacterium]
MKLLVVDGNSILNRAYYGVKPLTNHRGVYTNAIFGFFNILLKAISDDAPDGIVIAFDLPSPTFRHKAVASYKATRKGMPEELAMQLPLTKQILTAMGLHVVTCEGWEADDILGTLSAAGTLQKEQCVLLTGDRDNLQLINEYVTVRLATNREQILFTTEKFIDEYGFEPKKLIDLKALMGDSSDNIAGVQGIGEKTASALIREYGTIEALYEALPDAALSPAVRRKLEAGEADAMQSKFLATIVTDAPISTTLNDYLPKPRNEESLSALLTDLELFKLMERLNVKPSATLPQEDSKATPPVKLPTLYSLSAEELSTLCSKQDASIDFLLKDQILYIAYGSSMARVTNPAQIAAFLQSPSPKRTFDAKPVYRQCMERGETIGNLILDAAICAYLLNPATPEYTIERLCVTMGIPYPDNLGEYAEIAVLPSLCDRLAAEVTAQGMEPLMRDIELPLVEVLADMETVGVRVDAEGVRAFGDKLTTEISALEQRIYELVGHTFNILSPKQLGVVLFEELPLPAGKKTKTGWSTNAEVLEGLRLQHPVVELILQYRQLTKLNSTYVEGLLKTIAPDGRIHTCYRQTETRTGRISSTEPNLQNIPVRTTLGREMRKFFIAAEGCTLLDADYSQIELRLVAHLCGDENMQRSFIENRDIHRTTAAQVFNLPEEMITKDLRSAAKAVNFGILYGISAFSLSKDIGVTVAKADRYIKDYLQSFPNVERFMQETVEHAKATGFVSTMFGRKRPVPELRASNKIVQAAGKRIAMNTPIQGTAADIIKAAMVRVWRRLRNEVPNARLILQIHDELIVEAPLADRAIAASILQSEMEQACKLSVPLTADVEEGASWYDAKG